MRDPRGTRRGVCRPSILLHLTLRRLLDGSMHRCRVAAAAAVLNSPGGNYVGANTPTRRWMRLTMVVAAVTKPASNQIRRHVVHWIFADKSIHNGQQSVSASTNRPRNKLISHGFAAQSPFRPTHTVVLHREETLSNTPDRRSAEQSMASTHGHSHKAAISAICNKRRFADKPALGQSIR